jgi:hypothetical protein
MPHSDVLARFPDARRAGTGWAAKCPAHEDHRASLSFGRGDDDRWLLHCHAGCANDAILSAVQLETRDLFPPNNTKPTIVAEYHYRDEGGAHLFDVIRFANPKDFRQRRVDGVWKMDGVRRVVYRLNELQGKSVVYIAEGEKDVDRLWSHRTAGDHESRRCQQGETEWREQVAMARRIHGPTARRCCGAGGHPSGQ